LGSSLVVELFVFVYGIVFLFFVLFNVFVFN